MVVSLSPTQQGRVYNSFSRDSAQIRQMDEATLHKKIENLRGNLQQRLNETNLQGLHLQDAMIDYLLIREHEDFLHLPRMTVPVILVPLFQNISHPELQAVVTRLAAFPTPAVLVNAPQPARVKSPAVQRVSPSLKAKYAILIDSYNAVRDGRITSPETIREIARRFSEIENDPETNKSFPYNAGEAARILLRQANMYEAQARMRKNRKDNSNWIAGG